jgi:hypothetical protein
MIKRKSVIKIVIDVLMLVLLILEFSRVYTGQLLHEIFGIALFLLFIIHNVLNISYYKNILKGSYSLSRTVMALVNSLFLICMVFTIVLGISISQEIFKGLNLSGNMTVRKLHTILGYWNLVLLSIHLGLHFKTIFAKLIYKIKDKKNIKVFIYIVEAIIVIFGFWKMIKINLAAYLFGKLNFAINSTMFLSIFNNFITVLAIGIITYNIEKLILKLERRN